jgi:hypothetical protein
MAGYQPFYQGVAIRKSECAPLLMNDFKADEDRRQASQEKFDYAHMNREGERFSPRLQRRGSRETSRSRQISHQFIDSTVRKALKPIAFTSMLIGHRFISSTLRKHPVSKRSKSAARRSRSATSALEVRPAHGAMSAFMSGAEKPPVHFRPNNGHSAGTPQS